MISINTNYLMLTTLIPNKLLVGSIPDILNDRIESYLDEVVPKIINENKNSLWSKFFGLNMNKGIKESFFFDQEYLSSHPNIKAIVTHAYNFLSDNHFDVSPHSGLINIDIYEVDTNIPVNTNYIDGARDNDISMDDYNSCIFYARKDDTVKGDLEIYTGDPGWFDDGNKIVLPTINKMMLLRGGDVPYNYQPHSGKGVEIILSIHFNLRDYDDEN